jgi:hypothetical protein
MFQYLLLGYIVLYAVIALGMFSLHAFIVTGEEKKDDKAWETPLDLVLALIGLAGMLLLYLGFEPVWLKLAIWRVTGRLGTASVSCQLRHLLQLFEFGGNLHNSIEFVRRVSGIFSRVERRSA